MDQNAAEEPRFDQQDQRARAAEDLGNEASGRCRMRLVELSRSEHAGLRIRADLVEASAANQHLVPIVVSEFRKAATQYPIVFAKNAETGRFAHYVSNGLRVEGH